MKEIRKFSLTLLVICVSASFCLSVVYAVTKPQIEKQKTAEELSSLKEVVPEAKDFNPVKKNEEIIYYEAKNDQGETLAYAFKACGKGYSSTIETMVGITPEGVITNIKIISQNETPGLGSRIAEVEQNTTLWEKIKGDSSKAATKPAFQTQFSNKSLSEFHKLDTISGATISSKAVIESIKNKAEEILQLIKNE